MPDQPTSQPQPQPKPVPQPIPSQPTENHPVSSTTPTNKHVSPQAPTQQPSRVAKLPQTGNDHHVGIVGLGIMALLMGLGFAGKQLRHDDY